LGNHRACGQTRLVFDAHNDFDSCHARHPSSEAPRPFSIQRRQSIPLSPVRRSEENCSQMSSRGGTRPTTRPRKLPPTQCSRHYQVGHHAAIPPPPPPGSIMRGSPISSAGDPRLTTALTSPYGQIPFLIPTVVPVVPANQANQSSLHSTNLPSRMTAESITASGCRGTAVEKLSWSMSRMSDRCTCSSGGRSSG
jgi:hypothetical protein